MKFIERAADAADGRLNPIAVKELRQFARSRYTSGGLILILLVFTAAMMLFLMSSIGSPASGRRAFEMLFDILFILSVLAVPLYVGGRMIKERSAEDLDLLFCTPVKPGAIIRGKLLAGIVLTLLIFSVCLPFMSFTYLLRGVDLFSIFVIMAFVFTLITVASQIAICSASVASGQAARAMLVIVVIAFLTIFPLVDSVSGSMLRRGVGGMLGTLEFWKNTALFFTLSGLAGGFAHTLAAALVSPPAANRAFSVRLFLGLAWLITGCVAYFYGKSGWQIWHTCVSVIAGLGLLVSANERDEVNTRVAKEIPKNRAMRFPAFFLFSGAANGIAFMTVMATLTYCISFYFSGLKFGKLASLAGMFLYCYCYTLTGLFIRNRLLCKLIKQELTWLVVLIIVAASQAIPAIVLGFFIESSNTVFFANMFDLMENKQWQHYYFAGAWAILVTILNFRWFARQIAGFGPPGKIGRKTEQAGEHPLVNA